MTQHPTLHRVVVRCSSCGASFDLRSTTEAMSIDICSSCHPAYAGHERPAIHGSRIERFNLRRARARVASV